MQKMTGTEAINGAFGKLYHDGEWMANVTNVEVNGEINYEEVPIAGSRTLGHKATTILFEGTATGHKVSRKFVELIGQVTDDTKGAFVTELLAEVDDPENTEMRGFYRIKGVQFKTIPVINYEHGTLMEEELQFVCTGYEFIGNRA